MIGPCIFSWGDGFGDLDLLPKKDQMMSLYPSLQGKGKTKMRYKSPVNNKR